MNNNDHHNHDHSDPDLDIEARSFSNHEPQLLRDDRDEEFAAELTPDRHVDLDDDDIDLGVRANSVTGWIALALSIVSFFMLPIILGGAGIILGFVARNRDAEWLGNTAIVAGIISIAIRLFILPFF